MGSPFTNCSHVYLLVLLVLLVPIACSSLITTENKLRKETENTMHSNRVMLVVEAREIIYLSISSIESAKISHMNKNEREQNVHNCTQWIFNVFGECVVNKLEMSAFWIGISSIGICLLAQLPQMIENMKRQDAGALSITFLILMLLADIVDCVGTIFIYYVVSHFYAGIFCIIMDIILILQWLYYKGKTALKERKFRTKFSAASVDEYLTKHHPSSYGHKSKQILTYGTYNPSPSSTQKNSHLEAFSTSNFGYSYYQREPNRAQHHPSRKAFINENESIVSVYSETESEVLAAYDTQDEDNFYHHHRSHPIDISKVVVVVEHEQNNNSISRITPSRLNFLNEKTLSNSDNSISSNNKNRNKGNNQLYLIFLPLLFCGLMLYRYSTFEYIQQPFDAVILRHSNGRSLLQFNDQREQIMKNVQSRDSTWSIIDKLSSAGYILGWIAAVLSTLARIDRKSVV